MNWLIKLVAGGAVMGLAGLAQSPKTVPRCVGELVTPKPRWYAALSFYFIYLVGVIVFCG